MTTDVKKELSEVKKYLLQAKCELRGLISVKNKLKEMAVERKETVARHALLEWQLQFFQRFKQEVDHQRTFHARETEKLIGDIQLSWDEPRLLVPIMDVIFKNMRQMNVVHHKARRDAEVMAGLSKEIGRVKIQMDMEMRELCHFNKRLARDFKSNRKQKALLEERRDNLMAQLSLAKKRALRRNGRFKNERQMQTRGQKAAVRVSNAKNTGAKSVQKSKQWSTCSLVTPYRPIPYKIYCFVKCSLINVVYNHLILLCRELPYIFVLLY